LTAGMLADVEELLIFAYVEISRSFRWKKSLDGYRESLGCGGDALYFTQRHHPAEKSASCTWFVFGWSEHIEAGHVGDHLTPEFTARTSSTHSHLA